MEKTIFVVDDIRANLFAAEQALEDQYNVITAPSGARALELLDKIKPELILLDIDMPDMNGFEVLAQLKSRVRSKDIPVVMLTGMSDTATEVKGFEMGAVDFISKPFSTPVLLNRVRLQLDISEKMQQRTAELMETFKNRIFILTDVMEKRNNLTSTGRTERTSKFVKLMIEQMQEQRVYYDEVRDWNAADVASSSMLHNIGKISITDTILAKPYGTLTDEELETLCQHPTFGENIINQVIGHDGENQFLLHAKLFAKNHHERWDGGGYPCGLSGGQIPLEGRIMAIVDVYDNAISSVGGENIGCAEAAELILQDSGARFDPALVEVFRSASGRFEEICRESRNL